MKEFRLPHPRFVLFLAVLVVVSASVATVLSFDFAMALGFDAAAAIFVLSAAPLWSRGTPDSMRYSAALDDGGHVLLLGVLVIVLIAVFLALGLVIKRQHDVGVEDLGLVILTLVLAWTFSNLVYAFHYAQLYYDQERTAGDHGGLAFPGFIEPEFSDFCYFSFVLGMTYQVSDVQITSPRLRRVATFHGISAFFFNLGVLALTINVLAAAL